MAHRILLTQTLSTSVKLRIMKFTIVTGNPGKIAEFKRLIPVEISFDHHDVDLEEVQSLDNNEIVTAKVKAAYSALQRPVVVEDVTAGLDELGGLPGPFIKFFEKQMGFDALYKLRGQTPATVVCTIGYYDGVRLLIGSGTVHGRAVKPRGEFGFGFDACFEPNGQTKTFAEMPPGEKDACSHRSLAVADLIAQLKWL